MSTSKSFIDFTPQPSGQKLETPPACPKCRSIETSSAAKRPTSHSYWRCLECGAVWNPGLQSGTAKR